MIRVRDYAGWLVIFGSVDPGDSPLPPLRVTVDRVRATLKYTEPTKLPFRPRPCTASILGSKATRLEGDLATTF